MLIVQTLLASAASIIVLFALSKIMGNKQISQLNLFDYINGITIGSIAAEMALSDSWEMIGMSIIAMIVYGLTGYFISLATMNSMSARKFFSGEPLLLIENGKLYYKNIRKARLDLDDLLCAARCNGIYNPSDIALAVMETNGRISFEQTEKSRPINMTDLGQNPVEKPRPVNLIMDGIIMQKNLENANIKIKKLTDKMHEQGYSKPDDIFLAVMEDEQITFFPRNYETPKYDNYA